MFPLLIFLHPPNLSDLVYAAKTIRYLLVSKPGSMIHVPFVGYSFNLGL